MTRLTYIYINNRSWVLGFLHLSIIPIQCNPEPHSRPRLCSVNCGCTNTCSSSARRDIAASQIQVNVRSSGERYHPANVNRKYVSCKQRFSLFPLFLSVFFFRGNIHQQPRRNMLFPIARHFISSSDRA